MAREQMDTALFQINQLFPPADGLFCPGRHGRPISTRTLADYTARSAVIFPSGNRVAVRIMAVNLHLAVLFPCVIVVNELDDASDAAARGAVSRLPAAA